MPSKNYPEIVDELYKLRHKLSSGLTGLTAAVEALGYYNTDMGGAPSLLWRSYVRLMDALKEIDEDIVRRRREYAKLMGPMLRDDPS